MRKLIMPLVCLLVMTSCDPFSLIDKEPQNAREFLEANFEGSFTNERQIVLDPDSTRYDSSEYSSCKLTKFYSSFLQTDVVVVDKLPDKDDKLHSFSTNFLFIQYNDYYTDEIQKLITPDFSDSKVLYDYDWMFSHVTQGEKNKQEFLDYEWYAFKRHNLYILINVSSEELPEIETRLKSISFRLYSKNRKNHFTEVPIYFFITTPQSRSGITFDYDSIKVDDFFNNQEVRQIISKAYKQEDLLLEEIQP